MFFKYFPRLYISECTVGRFGEECAKECHCSDSFQCARETGLCRNAGCFSGWQGAACDKGTDQDNDIATYVWKV